MTVFALWQPNTAEFGVGLMILAVFLLTFAKHRLLQSSAWLALIGILMHIANYPKDKDDWVGCTIALVVFVVINRLVMKIPGTEASK